MKYLLLFPEVIGVWLVCGMVAAWRGREFGWGCLSWIPTGPIGLFIQLFWSS